MGTSTCGFRCVREKYFKTYIKMAINMYDKGQEHPQGDALAPHL